MSGAVFIDLGEEWSVDEERQARPRRRPARLAPLAGLLLVVVLLLAGGSAVTASPFATLATIDVPAVSATEFGGGGLFVAGGTGTDLFVARYAPDTGAMTWKTAITERADALAYLPGPGVLTVWYYGQDAPSRVTTLDGATGALLWELTGDLYAPPAPDARQALTVVVSDPNSPGQARYLDLRTGRAIWTRPVPAAAQVVSTDVRAPSDAAGFVLVAALDGTVTLLARDTGAVLGSLKIDPLVPGGADTAQPPDIPVLNLIGGRLLVARRIYTPDGEVSSYDLPGLTLRWRRTGALSGYPWPCGANLCLSGVSNETAALDPATGATRWTIDGWQNAGDLGGGRILAFKGTSGSLDHFGVLDSTTGRLLGDFGNWALVSGPDYHLAARPIGDGSRTWIGVVDPVRAMVRPVGMLVGPRAGGCISRGDVLACRTLGNRVQVWRYNSGR